MHEPWLLSPVAVLPPPTPLFLPNDGCTASPWERFACGMILNTLTHPDERVRYHAVVQFARSAEYHPVEALRSTLAADPSAAVREAAARSLAKLGSFGEIPALRKAAREDVDEDVKRIAAFGAEMIEDRCGISITHLLSLEKTPLIQNGQWNGMIE
jgi:hypothetical protein